ncbi:OmpA/MotB domain-containing protein [Candidatus Magnetoovum chiemensis]|nr:OmpA/MotB domain-containing protein [Candidatus Magnetoovum chiemensis]
MNDEDINISKEKIKSYINKRAEEIAQETIKDRLSQKEKEFAQRENLLLRKLQLSKKLPPESYIYKARFSDLSASDDDWQTTFSDIITLMLTMFVMMFALSTVDQKKFETVKQAINKEVLKKEENTSFQSMKQELEIITSKLGLEKEIMLHQDIKGLKIELASASLYEQGSAEIKKEIMPLLENITNILKNFQFQDYIIEVEGHTDNTPINTPKYSSNWELSTNRATNIVRFFIDKGLNPKLFRAAGYADSKPKLPNIDSIGNAISQNQAANRRVIIFIQRNE